MKEQKLAKSDVALRDIRKALEKRGPILWRFGPKLNARIQVNVARHERAKFKSFLRTVEHLGDVDLEKIARRVRVSKEVFDKWMNTLEVSSLVHNFLNRSRRQRATTLLSWAKMFSKRGKLTLKAPLSSFEREIPPDSIDYGNMLPLAKEAAVAFERPTSFRMWIEMLLDFHEHGGMSSAKQFFIDLGKCLSHGIRGTRGIKPELWDKLDLDIADIILSHDPPISDKDAVHELQNRGHMLRGHLPALEVRFRQRKHRLLFDARSVALSSVE
jgi:hypothetical protein